MVFWHINILHQPHLVTIQGVTSDACKLITTIWKWKCTSGNCPLVVLFQPPSLFKLSFFVFLFHHSVFPLPHKPETITKRNSWTQLDRITLSRLPPIDFVSPLLHKLSKPKLPITKGSSFRPLYFTTPPPPQFVALFWLFLTIHPTVNSVVSLHLSGLVNSYDYPNKVIFLLFFWPFSVVII